jgi:hypothetical protein
VRRTWVTAHLPRKAPHAIATRPLRQRDERLGTE